MSRAGPSGPVRRMRVGLALVLVLVLASACQVAPTPSTTCVFDAANATFDRCTYGP